MQSQSNCDRNPVIVWRKLERQWEAIITIDGKRVHLGFFESETAASKHINSVTARLRVEHHVQRPWAHCDGVVFGRSGRPLLRVDSRQNAWDSNPVSRKADSTKLARLEASSANTQHVLSTVDKLWKSPLAESQRATNVPKPKYII